MYVTGYAIKKIVKLVAVTKKIVKDPYQCPYCNQRSTRRWNLNVHIKRNHGGLPGPYLASYPSYNIESDQFGSAMVADSAGDTFLKMHLPQQTPVPIPIYRPPPTIQDQSYRTGLSQEVILKIDELKRLVNKYPQHCTNPDGIIRVTVTTRLLITSWINLEQLTED